MKGTPASDPRLEVLFTRSSITIVAGPIPLLVTTSAHLQTLTPHTKFHNVGAIAFSLLAPAILLRRNLGIHTYPHTYTHTGM